MGQILSLVCQFPCQYFVSRHLSMCLQCGTAVNHRRFERKIEHLEYPGS